MAFDKNWLTTGLIPLRGQSDVVMTTDDEAGRIVNMRLTREGTLRAVQGPVEYHPADFVPTGTFATTDYTTPHAGIFHAKVGKRDILLAAFGDVLYEHRGWAKDWRELVSESGTAAFRIRLPEPGPRTGFLWQFEATPNGIVIVPPGGLALFYDGTIISPLGYTSAPSAPQPLGPSADFDVSGNDRPNAGGYSHQGRSAPSFFGPARLGTLSNEPAAGVTNRNPNGATLRQSEWRAAVRWIDNFGNLSPLSPLSEPLRLGREDNYDDATKRSGETLRAQGVWANIAKGRAGTVGRVLASSKDLANSGDPKLYNVLDYATQGTLGFATLPDNVSTLYPYNIPDQWLVDEAVETDPVPRFRLCALAFGRLWVANTLNDPGLVRPSLPGRWGTLPKDSQFYPDATGAEVTGLVSSQWGLLVFTETSVSVIRPNDAGDGFILQTLNARTGCTSPDSVDTMPDGRVVWLGREHFLMYDGEQITPITARQQRMMARVNGPRKMLASAAVDPEVGEYRCWLPVDGSATNNACFVWDGLNWKERYDVNAGAVCVTKDHRQYMLALGSVDTGGAFPHNSVWVLDRDGTGAQVPVARESFVETTWVSSAGSDRNRSPQRATLFLREADTASISVEAMKDWRPSNVLQASVEAVGYRESDPPAFLGSTLLGAVYTSPVTRSGVAISYEWLQRRPYTDKVDVHVPSCDVFKLRIKKTGDWEFVGLALSHLDRAGGGAKKQ